MTNSTDSPQLERIVEVAERTLSSTLSTSVRLHTPVRLSEEGRRGAILRCSVTADSPPAPLTVLVKQVSPDAYNPDESTRASAAWNLFNDWAGTELLTRILTDKPVAPRFYGGNRDVGLM